MVRRKKQSRPRRSSAKNLRNQQTTVQRAGVQSHLSRGNYSNRDRKLPSVIRGKAISSRPSSGSARNPLVTTRFPIGQAHGTKNGPKITAALTIQIPLTETTIF